MWNPSLMEVAPLLCLKKEKVFVTLPSLLYESHSSDAQEKEPTPHFISQAIEESKGEVPPMPHKINSTTGHTDNALEEMKDEEFTRLRFLNDSGTTRRSKQELTEKIQEMKDFRKKKKV